MSHGKFGGLSMKLPRVPPLTAAIPMNICLLPTTHHPFTFTSSAMTLDSCLTPPPETTLRRHKHPFLSSKSAESHATKSARDARRRRLDLRRIKSSPPDSSEVLRSSYGKISVVGRRRAMDDALAVELGFVKRGGESYDFFGVFDGHERKRVAREMLAEIVGEEATEKEEVKRMSGSGVAAVVGGSEVVVAGSKAVVCRGGAAVRLLESDEACVRFARRHADEFLILGSGGFWDGISGDLACQIATRYCGGGSGGAEAAAAKMAEMALAQGSRHNVSVILVDLRGENDGIPTPSV
ncbi:protein phosphatase 2C 51-like [Salvia miltiorrhiza]|uniref:protein phosphatase 2C 51-like n=1 Tax=Salvia miltiorrhiza TaxID=226208 RepID=UPI0025ACC9E8|nr:protein phosphatase 2C 51-like [Salvia miltiorrhiza]